MPLQIGTHDLEAVDGITPSAPATGLVRVGAIRRAGRHMLAALDYGALRPMPFQSHFAYGNVRLMKPAAGSATMTVLGIAAAATGTATLVTPANTSFYTSIGKSEYLVTTASTSAVAGLRSSVAEFWRGNAAGLGGFYFSTMCGPATGPSTTAGTLRFFAGMVGATGAPTDVNPSTITQCIGLGCDSTDTNMQFMHHTGTGAITKVDLGASFPKPTTDRSTLYHVEMFCPPHESYIEWRVANVITGAVASGVANTNLPAAGTMLNPRLAVSVGGTSSVVGIAINHLYIETQY